jgi:hypothetical protein
MQAADGKKCCRYAGRLSVPHDTRQEPAELGRTGPLAKVTRPGDWAEVTEKAAHTQAGAPTIRSRRLCMKPAKNR